MKKLAYLALSGTALLLTLAACHKNDDPTPPSRTDYLTGHTWKPSSGTIVYTDPSTGKTISEDAFDPCEKDNFYKFNTDKTLVADEGATRCDPSDPQQETGTWAISNGDQQLTMILAGQALFSNATIKELSATTLHITGTDVDTSTGSPIPTTFDATFVAQ